MKRGCSERDGHRSTGVEREGADSYGYLGLGLKGRFLDSLELMTCPIYGKEKALQLP